MPIVDFILDVARVIGLTLALGFFFGLGFWRAAALVGWVCNKGR